MTPFVALTRHRIDPEDLVGWMARARTALEPLVGQVGCNGGEICAAIDDPSLVVVITRWDSVGAYRRGMSAFDVKMHTIPFLSTAVDEPSAFEVLHHNGPEGAFDATSDRAADADRVNLGEAARGDVPPRI